MAGSIEDAIRRHIQETSGSTLRSLYQALLESSLLVPLFAELTTDVKGRTEVPVRCVHLPDGGSCIPVFTSVDRLLEWDTEGSLYAETPGATLFKMASGMSEIDCVYVNYSGRQGTPKGKVTRREFELLAQGVLPENPRE